MGIQKTYSRLKPHGLNWGKNSLKTNNNVGQYVLLYRKKSGDYVFSMKTYSGQKKRRLLKFMSIVFPDGYVLDTIGLFLSDVKKNDDSMTKHLMTLNEDII